MAFEPRWTQKAQATFLELQRAASSSPGAGPRSTRTRSGKPGKAAGFFKQVEKCVRLLLENPRHPGLHTHEFHSIEHPYEPDGKVFEAYVQNRTPGAYRLFWCYGPEKDQITIIAITPHP
jgi:hypothetical protein